MCIHVNGRGRGSQPDSTEGHLNQWADGNDQIGCPWKQPLPHLSPWGCDLESQDYSDGFSQNGGNSHSEHDSKCHLLEDAGGSVGMANEKERAGENASDRTDSLMQWGERSVESCLSSTCEEYLGIFVLIKKKSIGWVCHIFLKTFKPFFNPDS